MSSDVVKQSRENITIFIKEKLGKIVPFNGAHCSIYRVPKRLLDMKSDAYVPRVISIGPFHHSHHNFKVIEDLKIRFFNSYKQRLVNKIDNNVDNIVLNIVEKVQNWEEKARQHYSEAINMKSEEFVKMLILDGCFIVEFMIMHQTNYFPKNDNEVQLSTYIAIRSNINLDLILLENQLPFFVLQGLFDLVYPTRNSDATSQFHDETHLFKVIVHAFLTENVLPIIKSGALSNYMLDKIQDPRHLLDFLSSYFVHGEKENEEECLPPTKCRNLNNKWDIIIQKLRQSVDSLNSYFVLKKNIEQEEKGLPPSVTELREAGVVFKKVESDSTCIMDISFKNGILNIPPIRIFDEFETCARNLMIFAEVNNKKNVTDYFQFLDELITTERDVDLLTNEGIIVNSIGGSNEEISHLFNNICRYMSMHVRSGFGDIAKDLNRHCKKKRHRWMAILRHRYFNTPWALISFLAATFLILLTLLQTIFTIYK